MLKRKNKTLDEEIHDLNVQRVKLLKQQIKMQRKELSGIRRQKGKQSLRHMMEKMAAKPVPKRQFAEKAFGNAYLRSMLGKR